LDTNCPASSTLYVVGIQSQCVATTPTNQARTTIGVGEEVRLTACGVPPGDLTWTTDAGTLTRTNGASTVLTAPGNAAIPIVTLVYTSGSYTKGFSVIEPAGVNMVTNGLRHTVNRPDIGFRAGAYVAPDWVNFGAVSCVEVTNNAVGTGVYSMYNGIPHDRNPAPFSLSATVVPGLGTSAEPTDDNVYSGNPTNAPPFAPGSLVWNIPMQFRVGTNAWKTFITLPTVCSLGANGILNASKAGASWSCNVADPSVSYQP
jgi:hypothetical protein